jgi:EAL domain-containing protein (putative c-di-GMP-specific phosphodiesterase class I)
VTNLERENDATTVARRILSVLGNGISILGHKLQCSVSIGIALHPLNAKSSEELTKYADIAMYRAKKRGRNQLCYFEEEMQQQFSRAYQIEVELKEAIKNQEFELHYQPVIDSATKNIVGVEALIRWPGCSLSSTPDEFIPIAEQSRVIEEIGAWVLDTAIHQISVWQKSFNESFTMAINISAVQLGNAAFISSIEYLLSKHHVRAGFVILELTETALLNQDETHNQRITQLCELGCKLALDDFGTGFSSLSHLLNYPINIVKLDKSLLPSTSDEIRHLSIVKGIAAMAKTIGLHIVAEGVETQFQCTLCDELNIDELQGYFFAKPLPAIELEQRWLKNFVDNISKIR